MSNRDLLIRELDGAPEPIVQEVLDFARFLRNKQLAEGRETALASEEILKRDWLRSEEDQAWQNL